MLHTFGIQISVQQIVINSAGKKPAVFLYHSAVDVAFSRGGCPVPCVALGSATKFAKQVLRRDTIHSLLNLTVGLTVYYGA